MIHLLLQVYDPISPKTKQKLENGFGFRVAIKSQYLFPQDSALIFCLEFICLAKTFLSISVVSEFKTNLS